MKSSLMPVEYKSALLEACRRLPNVTFIWKYETADDGSLDDVENVEAVEWMPQLDVLSSGRLTAFLTHGGTSSVMEAMYSGENENRESLMRGMR